MSLSSGITANAKVQDDIMNAQTVGQSCLDAFVKERIETNAVDFYAKITKNQLQTFDTKKRTSVMKVKDQQKAIRADRETFARLLTIQEKRGVDLKEVVKYELGILPLSIADVDGTRRKNDKSKLFQHLAEDIKVIETIPEKCPKIFDGMVLLQKLPHKKLKTFGDISEYLWKKITSGPSNTSFFVTDFYLADSVKSMERDRRSKTSGSLRVKVMRSDQAVPKQFSMFLSNAENKLELLDFLLKDWSTNEKYCNLFGNKEIYFTIREQAVRIWCNQNQLLKEAVPDLSSKQEEADTKMFLCAAYASQLGFDSVNIITVDSDVAILSLHFQPKLDVEIYLQMGTGFRERIYQVGSNDLSLEVLDALPSIHALSGCDSTSAFSGIGKKKIYKTVTKEKTFLKAAGLLGTSMLIDESVLDTLEEMFCRLYGYKKDGSINECRYKAILRKKKLPKPEKVPPTQDSLRLHFMRCNYQIQEWRNALDVNHVPNDPDGCGWERNENVLEIKWMTAKPAPEELLEFTTCACKKTSCITNRCQCYALNLECLDLCECSKCKNEEKNENDNEESEDEELDAGDSEQSDAGNESDNALEENLSDYEREDLTDDES